MFGPNSRYAVIPNLIYSGPEGQEVVYKARRFIPRASQLPMRGEANVQQGDRLDIFTARYFGPPTLFWHVADANEAMDPFELVAVPGRSLKIPTPTTQTPLPSLEG